MAQMTPTRPHKQMERTFNCKLCKGTGTYRGYTGLTVCCSCPSGIERHIDSLEAETLNQSSFQHLSRPEQVALMVRFNAERWAIKNGYKRSLQMLCGLCSAALARALRREGFRPTVVEGEVGNWSHAWVTLQGKFIDITFTQFDGCAPKVLVQPKTDKRFRPKQYFNGRRLDAWLTHPSLRPKDVEALTTFHLS